MIVKAIILLFICRDGPFHFSQFHLGQSLTFSPLIVFVYVDLSRKASIGFLLPLPSMTACLLGIELITLCLFKISSSTITARYLPSSLVDVSKLKVTGSDQGPDGIQ